MNPRAFLLFLLLAFQSCSQQILVPGWFDVSKDKRIHNSLDHKGILIVAENIEVNDQHIVFDVEIKNDTDHRVQFDPQLTYFLGSNIPYPSEHDTRTNAEFESTLAKHYTLSEREVARHFEQQIKRQKRTNLITGILTVGLIAFDAASSVKAMSSEGSSNFFTKEAVRSMVTMGGLAAMDVVREQAAMDAAMASEDLHFLPHEILEEGVIGPGKTFRGKMFFNASSQEFIRLIIPVGSNDFALDFRWATVKEQRKLLRTR